MSEKNDPRAQTHYTLHGLQPLEVMRKIFNFNQLRGFLRGNVLKYVMRYPLKGEAHDLEKALHYLELLVEHEGGQLPERMASAATGFAAQAGEPARVIDWVLIHRLDGGKFEVTPAQCGAYLTRNRMPDGCQYHTVSYFDGEYWHRDPGCDPNDVIEAWLSTEPLRTMAPIGERVTGGK